MNSARVLRYRIARYGLGVVVLLAIIGGGPAVIAGTMRAAEMPQVPFVQSPVSTAGRVVVTVTALEGLVRMPGVDVELRADGDETLLGKTVTDGAGQVGFPDIQPGRYVIKAVRPGFIPVDSAPFDVQAGEVTQVLLDIRLTFAAPGVEVHALSSSPTESVQPVSTSDMLSGRVLEIAPLEGDDFQSLLPILPGIVRGPDGRLRIKGGQPTQGGLQISSTSLVDPSTGEFDLDLPGQSLESVEVLANPFAAEYGRFSTSVTQIRTRRGTNDWEIKPGNLIPRFRGALNGIRGFEPRFSVRGPIKRDRVFFAQDFQFRYVATPVRSLPDEPEMRLRSFDSFTRVDSVISSRHTLGGGVVAFPREMSRVTLNTFRPPETTPDITQNGLTAGVGDRFAIAPNIVLESTVAGRWFEMHIDTDGRVRPMTYAPETQSGGFFNDQERTVSSLQWVEAVTISKNNWQGEHLIKLGTDYQYSSYEGESRSRPIEIRRANGSLAERIEYRRLTTQQVSGAEFSFFAQDRWRLTPRLTFELGLRIDRDDVVERVNWSPRAGVAIGVLPEGRGILRGGFGKFVQRTPLNIGAFVQFEAPVVTRFAEDGSVIGAPIAFRYVTAPDLRTPEALVGNVEWNQRFGRRLLLKLEYLRRHGSHDYVLNPDNETGEVLLSSSGASRYWEMEATARYLGGERRDITVSYVWSRGTADLNTYDQFFGNLRNPILRANENNLIPNDVPKRLIVRGIIGLPGKWDFAPVLEIRSGFPWSAVDEFQDFVGPRNRAGRLPTVQTLDFTITRPLRFKKFHFRGGLKVYNVFGSSSNRDVQQNIASPSFGQFFNPIERSIGLVIGSAR